MGDYSNFLGMKSNERINKGAGNGKGESEPGRVYYGSWSSRDLKMLMWACVGPELVEG